MPSFTHMYTFINTHPESYCRWWATARREFFLMALGVPFLVADLGAPPAPVIFASDAMGETVADHGGHGLVGVPAGRDLFERTLQMSRAVRMTVVRLDGGLSGLKRPEKRITPTIPFSRIPQELFDTSVCVWSDLDAGRWKWPDHITLGESRAVVRLLDLLLWIPSFFRRFVISLQDNRPTSGSMMKGRSPSLALNFLLRKKTARCLASSIKLFLPWVESLKMPADSLPRDVIQGPLGPIH